MEVQDTYAMLKPDALYNHLYSKVFERLEYEFQLVFMKMIWLEDRDVKFIYGKYLDQDFFPDLSSFMQSGPCVAMVLRRMNAVEKLREIIGAGGRKPGTIRGEYATSPRHNVIHASDSPSAANEELLYFFTAEEREQWGIQFNKVNHG